MRYDVTTYITIPPMWQEGGAPRRRVLLYSSRDKVKAVTFRQRLETEHPTMTFVVEERKTR